MQTDKEVIVDVSCKNGRSELILTLSVRELQQRLVELGAEVHTEKRDRKRLLRVHRADIKDVVEVCQSVLPRKCEFFVCEDHLNPIAAPISDRLIRTIKQLYRERHHNICR